MIDKLFASALMAAVLFFVSSLGSPALASSGQAGQTSGSCRTKLSYLKNELTYFSDPQLSDLRRQILSWDIAEIWRQYPGDKSMARKAIQQSKESANSLLASAENGIRKVSTNPEQVFRQLEDGTYRFGSSMTSDYARAYVTAQYQIIANREAAIILACLSANR